MNTLVPQCNVLQAIKLQYNDGNGGCFPLHVDSDAAVDNRLITAIFYLNPRRVYQTSHKKGKEKGKPNSGRVL